jgi:chromosome segregation ATPase
MNEENVSGLEPQEAVDDAMLSGNEDQSADLEQVEGDVEPTDEHQEQSDDQGDEQHEETEATQRKKGGVEKKIGKLTKRVADKDREIEQLRQQLQNQNGQGQQQPQVAETPKPKWLDYNGDIESYQNAMADWTVAQVTVKQQQAEHKQQQAKVVETYAQRAAEFAKAHPDFNEVMDDAEDIGPVAPEINQMIGESEHGPAIAYFLAQNVEEVERINALPAHKRFVELGKIEDKLGGSKGAPTKQKAVSKAPAPVTPVKGSSKAVSTGNDIYDPNLTTEQYKALRRKELEAKGLIRPANTARKF